MTSTKDYNCILYIIMLFNYWETDNIADLYVEFIILFASIYNKIQCANMRILLLINAFVSINMKEYNNQSWSRMWDVYIIWMWIDWYWKYQHVEPEYEVCCRVSEANEEQTSYSVEQADIFQYQSYSHSDDMFIILKSNIKTDTSIGFHTC